VFRAREREPRRFRTREVKPAHEFYSYDAKYVDANGALLEIPAAVTEAQKKEIRELAVRSYKTLCCEGMARADFFLANDGRILVNELNTLPGFTNISLYPSSGRRAGSPRPTSFTVSSSSR